MKTFKVLKEFAMAGQVYPVGSIFNSTDNGSTVAGVRFGQLELMSPEAAQEHAQDPRKQAEALVARETGKVKRPLTAGEVFDLATAKGISEELQEELLSIAQALGEGQARGKVLTREEKAQKAQKAKADKEKLEREIQEQEARDAAAREQEKAKAEQAAQGNQTPAQQS